MLPCLVSDKTDLYDPWREINGIVWQVLEILLIFIGTENHLLNFISFREEAPGVVMHDAAGTSCFVCSGS